METLVPPPALVALVPVVLPVVPVVVALVPVVLPVVPVVVALVPVVVALVPVVLPVVPVVVALVPVVLPVVPVAIVLKDGGTWSISGLMSGRGGNPYCSCSRSCCLTITCVEKSGPLYPIVVQSMITAANETPITSIPNATPRICGE